jgi:uncharacterized beta-barrel protein YwiB (DUF1934 family)
MPFLSFLDILMKAFKEARVTVASEITPIDDSGLPLKNEDVEKTETQALAFLKIEDGTLSLSYFEKQGEATTNTDITVGDKSVSVFRRGAIESSFVFEEGKSHKSLYKIPPYEFESEITTKKIRNTLTENGGVITIFYDMTVGGDVRRVKMRIEVSIQ